MYNQQYCINILCNNSILYLILLLKIYRNDYNNNQTNATMYL